MIIKGFVVFFFRSAYRSVLVMKMVTDRKKHAALKWEVVFCCCLFLHHAQCYELLFPNLDASTKALHLFSHHQIDLIPPMGLCNVPLLTRLTLNNAFKSGKEILHNDSFCCLSKLYWLEISNVQLLRLLPLKVFAPLSALGWLILKGELITWPGIVVIS